MRYSWFVLIALAGSPGLLSAQSPVAEVYTVDLAHSLLDFTTRLIGFNRVRGTFGEWQANFVYDPAAPTSGYVSFIAEVSSISTQVAQRDQHLKSPDFFDAARFPRISFEGHVLSAKGTRFEVEGPLTIRDSTRIIRFGLDLMAPEAKDPFGNRRLVFAGKVTLNRRDFGVHGPRFWSLAISDSVSIELELAGRIWEYTTLGFRNSVYGPTLVAAADSGRFDEVHRRVRGEIAAETDATRFPSPYETEVAVGRLIQAGHVDEALETLELFADVVERYWSPEEQSGYQTLLGQTLARLGRNDEARQHLVTAVSLDPTSTNARAWRTSVTRRTP